MISDDFPACTELQQPCDLMDTHVTQCHHMQHYLVSTLSPVLNNIFIINFIICSYRYMVILLFVCSGLLSLLKYVQYIRETHGAFNHTEQHLINLPILNLSFNLVNCNHMTHSIIYKHTQNPAATKTYNCLIVIKTFYFTGVSLIVTLTCTSLIQHKP